MRALCVALLIAPLALAQRGGPGGAIPQLPAPQAEAQAVSTARRALLTATFAGARDDSAIRAAAANIAESEAALAAAEAKALAQLQASANRLSAEQVDVLASRPVAGGGGRGGRGNSYLTQSQTTRLSQMTADVAPLAQSAADARTALRKAAFVGKATGDATELLRAAEVALATARAERFAAIQGSQNKLAAEDVAGLIAAGGSIRQGAFSRPEPMDFNDHEGYAALFDGVSLKGWDGNPKFWRAEGGAIVGESTPQNPSGNNYIVYRDVVAKDFTLKFEIKVEGSGGSGIQYRSKTGVPWLSPIAPNVTANVGPVNLNWMLTGPQADFWPSSPYWTGQFYSENTPMRILAWRGQVVEGAGMGTKRLMGTIGDIDQLGKLVKINDWNQYIVIARGGTFIHIVNGQLMAVMVDDDPQSSNNQPGLFGIEIEATTKVSVRNIWLKKLN